MLKREDIRIRDPFIFVDKQNKNYYMFGTTDLKNNTIAAGNTFSVYKSKDLENFEDAKVVVDGTKLGFWADKDFWAPEVYFYKGKYYLFGSVKADGKCRATQIFVCDKIDGEYKPLSKKARTPEEWECLDGTLYIEKDVPYMIFSHEWVQIHDGEICAVKLKDDLTERIGEPIVLFKASDNKLVCETNGKGSKDYVTDGPFLFVENGRLKMLWSSFVNNPTFQYRIMIAESDGGLIDGRWTHTISDFKFDGGHAMLFCGLDGKRKISLHSPNSPCGSERATFYDF